MTEAEVLNAINLILKDKDDIIGMITYYGEPVAKTDKGGIAKKDKQLARLFEILFPKGLHEKSAFRKTGKTFDQWYEFTNNEKFVTPDLSGALYKNVHAFGVLPNDDEREGVQSELEGSDDELD